MGILIEVLIHTARISTHYLNPQDVQCWTFSYQGSSKFQGVLAHFQDKSKAMITESTHSPHTMAMMTLSVVARCARRARNSAIFCILAENVLFIVVPTKSQ